MFRQFVCTLVIVIVAASAVHAQTTPLTAEKLWQMSRLDGFQLSPDGNRGVFTVTIYDVEENKGQTNLYLIDLPDGDARRLTAHEGSDGSPAWSPDGKRIAFVSKRGDDEKSQLYVIPVDGGEAQRLLEMPTGVSSPQWATDSRIVFASRILPEFETDFEGLEKELKRRKDSKVTAKITENRWYRQWSSWRTDGYVWHLYSYNLETEERIDLMPGVELLLSFSGGPDYDISPDGTTIALTAYVTPPPYHGNIYNSDVLLIPMDVSGSARNITESNPGGDYGPVFTPNGRYLLYGRDLDPKMLAENTKLVRYDLKDGKLVELTADRDISAGGWQVAPNSKTIYFLAGDHGRTSIFKVGMNGKGFERVRHDARHASLRVAKDRLYFLHDSFDHPPTLYGYDLKKRRADKLTTFNDEIQAGIEYGQLQEHYFKGADNDDVQLYLITPPGFDASKKWPLVHMIHGGPHGAFSNRWHWRWNAGLFGAPGYVVGIINFHGSTSYGQEFAQSILGAHGDKPFTDIMKGTDYILENFSFIDETRMAASGGSYGGYLVNWIAGHTDRFACLISHAGVYNLFGQFASDHTHFREIAYGGAPWYNQDNVRMYSPAEYAENFETPTLIIHGEKDYRVVVTQGLEMYGVLQGMSVPSRLVYYPDENHWILHAQNSIHWYGEVHGWLDRWVRTGGE